MQRSHWLSFLIVLCAFTCFGQVSFKKGYYISKNGHKTECFIRDVDWKNSPTSFDYRLTETGDTQKVNTQDVSEFEVAGSKYIRENVRYDQSSQEIKKAGVTSNPDWAEGDLLLKVIVEGKATLFHYNTSNYSLFFFSVDKSPIEQLIFKNYLNPKDVTQLVANRMYVSQLNGKVRCADEGPVNYKEVPYQLKPLTNHFLDFNVCSGGAVQEKVKSAKNFSLRLTPGVDFSKVTGRLPYVRNYNFGSNTTFRLGVDLQFALPFYHGKWAVMAEPTYYTFSGADKNSSLKFQLLEFPIGIRHRFFLSEKNYVFVNAAVLVDFPISHVQSFQAGSDKTQKGTYGFLGGAGLSIGRFSVEARYYPERSRAGAYIYYYTKSTIIFGFRII